MTDRALPPDLAGELSSIKRRLDAIERRLNGLDSLFKPEIVFSYSGPLAAATSPTWTRREAGRMLSVVARLRVAGSTDTVIEVHRNGVAVVTVTIPAGKLYANTPCSITFAPDQDVLHDVITDPGTGAEDLTVQHRFKS